MSAEKAGACFLAVDGGAAALACGRAWPENDWESVSASEVIAVSTAAGVVQRTITVGHRPPREWANSS